jgi:hypothetical protein
MRYIITQEKPTSQVDILDTAMSLGEARKKAKEYQKEHPTVEVYMLSAVVVGEPIQS